MAISGSCSKKQTKISVGEFYVINGLFAYWKPNFSMPLIFGRVIGR
jgi:hypothetical protein